jgi:hypothetical protein
MALPSSQERTRSQRTLRRVWGRAASDLTRAPSEFERLSYYVNFASEIHEHVNQVIDCASFNQKAFTSRNIKAGWSKSGAWPLNPQRVLTEIRSLLWTKSSQYQRRP